MLYQYHIQHAGHPEHIGYVVADNHADVVKAYQERFPGWAEGSSAGCFVIKPAAPRTPPVAKSNLGWVHPMFADL